MSSYQIKSTPFFRRIISTSRKNGELQKLKEEYERIKEFNERTIELKMRQVRLRRLFREIEEIKENSGQIWKHRSIMQIKSKTPEDLRLEKFKKAKQLGKEFSKLNAITIEKCKSKYQPVFEIYSGVGYKFSKSSVKADRERKDRSKKRIVYGNEISRSNIQKISENNRRILRDKPPNIEKQRNMLLERLNYGNSRSSDNMTKSPRRHRLNIRQSGISKSSKSTEYNTSDLANEMMASITQDLDNLNQLELSVKTRSRDSNTTYSDIPYFVSMTDLTTKGRIKERWHKLFNSVREQIHSKLNNFEEYKLISASNDINHSRSQIHVDNSNYPIPFEYRVSEDGLNKHKSVNPNSSTEFVSDIKKKTCVQRYKASSTSGENISYKNTIEA